MKDEIKVIFFKRIGFHLDGEDLKYIVVQDGDNYQITEAPSSLNGIFSALTNYLCYDFDLLSNRNKMRYGRHCIPLKRVDGNIYSFQQKTKIKKENYFPKQN